MLFIERDDADDNKSDIQIIVDRVGMLNDFHVFRWEMEL